MKLIKLICILAILSIGLGADTGTNPETIVDKQIDAYNKRDIDAFCKTYHQDVEIWGLNGKMSYKGREELKKRYAVLFKKTSYLNAEIIKRIVFKNRVIDYERATFGAKDGKKNSMEVVAIYEIKDNLIWRVTFIQ